MLWTGGEEGSMVISKGWRVIVEKNDFQHNPLKMQAAPPTCMGKGTDVSKCVQEAMRTHDTLFVVSKAANN